MTLVEWSAIFGNFGELIGALLVGASLIYVAIQVRHNTDSSDEANMRAEAERIAGFSRSLWARLDSWRSSKRPKAETS